MAMIKRAVRLGLLPDGEFDTRSITDVTADELKGFRQWHFFAGIGGWPRAVRLAGYEAQPGLMTGSCPCQPFSNLGKRKGKDDARNLWPEMHRLCRELRPRVCFGEQVASPDGRHWLEGVHADLEDAGYAFAGTNLAAAGIGAPHQRQRLYWMAYDPRFGRQSWVRPDPKPDDGCGSWEQSRTGRWVGNAGRARLEGYTGHVNPCAEPRWIIAGSAGSTPETGDAMWCSTLDGKQRPVPIEPALFPLAHGFPNRVELLRGAGNAVVVPLAKAYIEAGMAAIGDVTQ